MSNQICNEIVVLGGGTAGFMTAASLCYRLKNLGVNVTLIESPDIGTIGVGEATVPAIKRFFESLELNIADLMRKTNATFKLGIEFQNWAKPNHTFFHPFGRYGINAGEIGFQHIFQLLKNQGEIDGLKAYSLGTEIALQNRFGMPNPNPKNDFEVFDWAIHFDAHLFANYLREFALSHGLKHVQGKVKEVIKNDKGAIEKLKLENETEFKADLFIDCSGMRAVLLQGALETGYYDWRKYLPCDSAVAIGCNHAASDISSYTRSRAQIAGWTWRIPLQNRIGNGYVYCSEFISDEDALGKLTSELDSAPINQPNFVKYITGHAKKIWNKNCVAIGLSAGFLEPLESTSISLIQIGIDKLIDFWPDKEIDDCLIDEYNRVSAEEYQRIRDFIILHYKANGRVGEKFWDYCRNMEIPADLKNKIENFKARGRFVQYNWESFFDPSWHAMYEGFGIDIKSLNPLCALLDNNELVTSARMIREDVKAFAGQFPSHLEFIKNNCASDQLSL